MMSRGTLIAALFALQLAVIAEAGVAVRSVLPGSWPSLDNAAQASGRHLAEGGPHEVFEAGEHPAVTIDIGYADLTILTGTASNVDVSLAGSSSDGVFRESAPIVASVRGTTVRVGVRNTRSWSTGDDRMVTVVVPPQAHVTVVNAGVIRATGLRADASFNSVGQGSITIEDYDAGALRASARGPVTLRRVAATHLDATSRDDRLEATALRVRDGSIESSDRATIGFATGTDSLVTADAGDGHVSAVGFPSSGIAGTATTGASDDSSTRIVRLGGGNGRLEVHASDGDITLAQEN